MYNPFEFLFYMIDLNNKNKLNVKELLYYFTNNFLNNEIQNQLFSNTTVQQKLVLIILHLCGVSVKVSSIIILFL